MLTAVGPALELPSRPGGHDRRQRAPVARKPGVCRFSRSHEFPGRLEEGALGLFV